MPKNVLYRLLSLLLIAMAIPWLLLFFSYMPNKTNNGFSRTFVAKELPIINKAPIKVPLSGISGSSDSALYLSGEDPRAILILDKNLSVKNTLLINIDVPKDRLVPSRVSIDSNMLYFHLNNLTSVYYGQFPKQKLNLTKLKTEIFTKSTQISKGSLVVRSFTPSLQNQYFRKMNIVTGDLIHEAKIIEDQNDAGLSSDGMMVYDKVSSKIIYVEYLKNELICMDTNLNVQYRSHTIDTTYSRTVKKGVELKNNGANIVSSAARVQVNKYAFINNRYLYIISGLRSDNEDLDSFMQNDQVDVYTISNGSYIGSFTLKKENSQGLRSAIINHDTLTALYPDRIVMYRLPKTLF